MRQVWSLPAQAVLFGLLACGACPAIGRANAPLSQSDALSKALVEHAQAEVDRIKPLVENGTLPRTSLTEAEAKLADAEDDETLMETLFGHVYPAAFERRRVRQLARNGVAVAAA